GYPTPRHLAALSEHGPTQHHRRSFAPVRRALLAVGRSMPDDATTGTSSF
ncbi:MAG TPA: ribonuclease HII, partial [Burkholderiaceae bacterium]|nr:ribonuclease HII [Burkholderiaceae bacterium]